MRTVVIFPGRFQPAHHGHKAVYDKIVKQFGEGNVFIATSDVQSPATSPFSFQEKLQMFAKMGVPTGKVALVKNPYQAQEITNQIPDKDDVALVFAVGAKDMDGEAARFRFGTKRDGSPSYMQPFPKSGKLKPLTQNAYVMVAPTVDFKVKGRDANSATEVRNLYAKGNDNDHKQIIQDLYGAMDDGIENIFDKKLLPVNELQQFVYSARKQPAKLVPESRLRINRLLKSVMLAEERVQVAYSPLYEDLVPDYLDEK
jgi:hypothetical protein